MDNFVLTEKGVVIKITNTSAEQVLTNDNGFISPTLKLSEESVHKDIIPAFKIRIPEYVSYGLINIAPGDSISFIVKKPNEVFYYIGLQDARMEGISISVTPVTDSVVLQDKVITPTTEEQIVTADEGYNGLGTVTINAMNLGTKTITASDTYNAADDGFDGYSSVAVDVPVTPGIEFSAEPAAFTLRGNVINLSVDIPDGVTSIGGGAFQNYKGLISVTIPESVTTIGEYAFSDCTGLTVITIPEGVVTIRYDAFKGCTGLTSITIPESVTLIDDWTFQDCTGLVSAELPSAMTSIGKGIFLRCSGLVSIDIPEGVTSIGENAFLGCASLTEIILPEGLTTLGPKVFKDCSGLESIEIPEGVTTIGYDAFSGATSLETITINKAEGSISGAPWGAPNAQVVWTG